MGMVVPFNGVYLDMMNTFKNDCHSLLQKFQDQKSGHFTEFAPVWKESKFNLIYEKYKTYGWYNDLKQDSLQIAKTVMLNEHFVGGLYLLYGLYCLQDDPKSSIRLEYCELRKLLTMLREERNSLIETCEPGFVFSKLWKNQAFEFVRFARDYSIESQNRARAIYNDQLISAQPNNTVNASEWFKGFLQKVDFIDDLRKVEEGYFEKKKKLKKENPELNLALDMVPDDIITGIENSLCQNTYYSHQSPNIGERRIHLKNMKRKIKYRYGEPSPSKLLKKGPSYKKKGAPKGMRKLFYKVMINEPASEDDSYSSDEDDPKLSLPDIF